MDETLRAVRRRRRRERRLLRRIRRVGPIALVLCAWLLSAGVVKLMEVPRGTREAEVVERPEAGPPPRARHLLRPDPRAELPPLLSTSILDHEVSGPPEESRPVQADATPELPEGLELPPEGVPPSAEPDDPGPIEPVPEPGTAVLVGAGLAVLGWARGPTRRAAIRARRRPTRRPRPTAARRRR